MRRAGLLLLASMSLGACASRPPSLYAWGNYEELIYASYAQPASMPPDREVERLEQDYQRARAANARMPPGWHAHLGYMYFDLGKRDEAVREFETEKAQYPEAGVFVDRLLANLSKS